MEDFKIEKIGDKVIINGVTYIKETVSVPKEEKTEVITNEEKPQHEEKLYSFGAFSDVHMPWKNGMKNDEMCYEDFTRALKYCHNYGVKHIGICGDITSEGILYDLSNYRKVLREFAAYSTIPVYTCLGNHETWYENWHNNETNDFHAPFPNVWFDYTGMGKGMKGDVEICPSCSADVCINTQGEHHIFLSVESHDWVKGKCDDVYKKPARQWLGSILEKYKNERCYIYMHFFFPSRCGNYGKVYNNNLWLSGDALKELEALADKYSNSIWFSGHSHCEWSLDENIFKNIKGGYCVHIPSCGEPRGVKNGEMYSIPEGSEFAVVDVYKSKVIVHAMSLVGKEELKEVKTYELKF